MKWVGYGLQGVGGLMAIAGLGVFAVGKLVERAASSDGPEASALPSTIEVEMVGEAR